MSDDRRYIEQPHCANLVEAQSQTIGCLVLGQSAQRLVLDILAVGNSS